MKQHQELPRFRLSSETRAEYRWNGLPDAAIEILFGVPAPDHHRRPREGRMYHPLPLARGTWVPRRSALRNTDSFQRLGMKLHGLRVTSRGRFCRSSAERSLLDLSDSVKLCEALPSSVKLCQALPRLSSPGLGFMQVLLVLQVLQRPFHTATTPVSPPTPLTCQDIRR